MTRAQGQHGGASVVTFHARVAGVGLITTVVALSAACAVFLGQQWVVARAEAHRNHQTLAEFTANAASRAVAEGRWPELQGSAMGRAMAVAPEIVSRRAAGSGLRARTYARCILPDRSETVTETTSGAVARALPIGPCRLTQEPFASVRDAAVAV
jgi:hypothetical protein